MAEENRVVLYGTWYSPYVKRIQIALKIKGIPFEYVEENLQNKSPELLKLNPVYKKVPVLVHNGNPISESYVILEYIDEVWSHTGPALLPQDPYKRAQIRFWADFIQKQLVEGTLIALLKAEGEEQEKIIKHVKDNLRVVEEQGLKSLLSKDSPFVNGHELGFLDLVGPTVIGLFEIIEHILGVEIVEQQNVPILSSWLHSFTQHPVVGDFAAPRDKLVELFSSIRQNAIKSSSSAAASP